MLECYKYYTWYQICYVTKMKQIVKLLNQINNCSNTVIFTTFKSENTSHFGVNKRVIFFFAMQNYSHIFPICRFKRFTKLFTRNKFVLSEVVSYATGGRVK